MKHIYLTVLVLLVSIASYAVVAPITGASQVCVGSTTGLSCATPGGTWTSSNPAFATVSGGTVTGVAAGAVTITYTVGIEYSIKAMTVNALPSLFIVTGGGSCAPGSHVGLSGSNLGVNYQLYKTGVPFGSPVAGTGVAIDFGLETLVGNYSVIATNPTTTCIRNMTGSVTVALNPLPNLYTPYFGGSGGICTGSPGVHIYLSGSQAPGFTYSLYKYGVFISALPGTGGILDFGAFTTPGMYDVIGTNNSTGCMTDMGAVTLYALPSPGAIAGPSGVCVGSTITVTDTAAGGVWTSSNPAVATVGSTTGVVTGLSVGTTTITYTLPSGCTATTSITGVNLIAPITGTTTICAGTSTTLSDASPGGTWVSSNPAVVAVGSSSGTITGVSAGTAAISYSVGTCGVVFTTITVNAVPTGITGVTSLCAGAVSTLHDATPGGTWTSTNLAVATIGTSGIVNGVSAGLSTVSYTVSGCAATTVVTVDPPPVITGPSAVCAGNTIFLNSSILGTWASSNPGVASVTYLGPTATVSGVSPGGAIITCTSISTGCVSTTTVNVTSTCTGTPTPGAAHLTNPANCSGNADLLYLTGYTTTCGTSYQWQYSIDSIAWGDVAGATNDSAVVHPTKPYYYRCKLKCYSTGLIAYSTPTRVSIYNSITSHGVLNTPTYFCNGPDFQLTTCGGAYTTNVKTYYGDGTWDTTRIYPINSDSVCSADIYHTYNLPGTYTVKQVLRDGTTPQDSIEFSFDYNYCRTLPVFFYFDLNNNCVFDNLDQYIYHPISTEVDSNGIAIDTIVSTNGFYYKALGDTGTIYAFKVISYDPGLHMSCPVSGIIYDTITPFYNTYAPKYMGFNCVTTTNFNLGITAGNLCARHVAWGNIHVYNTYCTPEAAVVTMNFSPKYEFSSSNPAPFSVVGHTVTWHLPAVSVYAPYYAWANINYSLYVPGTFLVSGDTVNTSYSVTPLTGDVDVTNNYFSTVDTIRYSYDPNVMSVLPAGYVIPCTPLQYTIRFENTGNDTAHNISVIDTLPDNVDARTIKIVSSTSVVKMTKLKFGGHTLVKFDFPHINLPDSSHHNKCDGEVIFTVKTKAGLADGTTIFNHASIYFDDNAPVQTNTVENIIGISPVTGPDHVCNTFSVVLMDASTGGTWTTTNTNATVVGGTVTGMAPGMDTVVYTISNSCATKSATQSVTTDPTVVPGVGITTSTGFGDTVCDGTVPIFTANPTDGGTTPVYDWQVNGTSSGTDATFSYTPLTNGDVVTVKLTSNAACAAPDTAVSTMILTVIEPFIAPITLEAYPGIFILPGTSDTFVATVPAGGPTPSYQWLLNGSPVPGATSDTFVISTLVNHDSVTCVATGNDLCKLSTFNSFIITVGYLGVRTIGTMSNVNMYPNPNKGEFVIKGTVGTGDEEVNIEVTNMMGQVVYKNHVMAHGGSIDERVHLNNALANGMYMLNLRSGSESKILHFVVEQ
jgi:uncharacterized protein YjdB